MVRIILIRIMKIRIYLSTTLSDHYSLQIRSDTQNMCIILTKERYGWKLKIDWTRTSNADEVDQERLR